ncbi:hypothetical protein IPJ72_05185 [Candidatus Peregrinibacteria bacterium]|nr:MAG: hypothetical protein IPJ72_05185 [Candidatus Peregrinibacteria bacterium]
MPQAETLPPPLDEQEERHEDEYGPMTPSEVTRSRIFGLLVLGALAAVLAIRGCNWPKASQQTPAPAEKPIIPRKNFQPDGGKYRQNCLPNTRQMLRVYEIETKIYMYEFIYYLFFKCEIANKLEGVVPVKV